MWFQAKYLIMLMLKEIFIQCYEYEIYHINFKVIYYTANWDGIIEAPREFRILNRNKKNDAAKYHLCSYDNGNLSKDFEIKNGLRQARLPTVYSARRR